jgi:hypothetical protein
MDGAEPSNGAARRTMLLSQTAEYALRAMA